MSRQRILQAMPTQISPLQRMDIMRNELGLETAEPAKAGNYRWNRYIEVKQADDHEHCDGCWARIAEGEWGDNFEYAWWSEADASWLCPQCHPFLEGYELAEAGKK